MIDFLLLNLFIGCFFLVSVYEEKIVPTEKQIQQIRKKIPPLQIISFFIASVILICLLLFKSHAFTWDYLFFSFGLLLIAHAVWISLGKEVKVLYGGLVIGFLIILYRFFFPSVISHTILLFFALAWLGCFLFRTHILNKKSFLVISLVIFIYNIFYTSLVSMSHYLHALTTNSVGFPLFISIGSSYIGTADIVWSVLFLAFLPTIKLKIIGVFTLLLINILIGFIALFTNNFVGLPLLIVWIPVGLAYPYLYKKFFLR